MNSYCIIKNLWIVTQLIDVTVYSKALMEALNMNKNIIAVLSNISQNNFIVEPKLHFS